MDLTIRETVYAPGLRMPRHSHEFSTVTVVVNGQIDEWAERGEYHGRACSVVLKPAGVEHENRVSGFGARTLTIQAARDSSIDRQIRQRSWGWFEEPDVARAAVALMRDRSRTWDLLAAVLSSPSPRSTQPAWLPKVKAILDERFDEHLRFEEIAEEVGLHPVYLSRAFHRHVGQSMGEYVRGLQLARARHLLSATRRSVTAIAFQSGFTDASHLSRSFSTLLGITPKVYRSLCNENRPHGAATVSS